MAALRAARQGGPRLTPVASFCALVVLLTAVGTVLGGLALTAGPSSNRPSQGTPNTFDIAQPITTSFGVVTVTGVENNIGLTTNDLGGMAHGIQGLVQSDQVQVQVLVSLTNTQSHAVQYSADLFQLIVGSGIPALQPSSSSIFGGPLRPAAHVEGRVSFVVPWSAPELVLMINDPAASHPILVNLGPLNGKPPADSGGGHDGHDGHHG